MLNLLGSRCRPPLSTSDKVIFSLTRDRQISFRKSFTLEGTAEITLSELLQKAGSRSSNGTAPKCLAHTRAADRFDISDVILPLQHKGKTTCTLMIQISESSSTALSGTTGNTTTLSVELISRVALGAADAAGTTGTGPSPSNPPGSQLPLPAEQPAPVSAVTPDDMRKAGDGMASLSGSDPTNPPVSITCETKSTSFNGRRG